MAITNKVLRGRLKKGFQFLDGKMPRWDQLFRDDPKEIDYLDLNDEDR